MSDTLADIRGWRPRFYLPKQIPPLAARGSRPPFLIGCTTTALKSDNATTVSECRPWVRDYFLGNRSAPSSRQMRRCPQYCVCSDQPPTARQLFQSRFGIRSEQFRTRASPENHAPDRPATLHFQIPALATVAPNRAGRSRENFPSHRLRETKQLGFVP